jgi:hypothetical protein
MYISGGFTDGHFSDALLCYNPKHDIWERRTPMQHPRGWHQMVTVKGIDSKLTEYIILSSINIILHKFKDNMIIRFIYISFFQLKWILKMMVISIARVRIPLVLT